MSPALLTFVAGGCMLVAGAILFVVAIIALRENWDREDPYEQYRYADWLEWRWPK